MDVEKKDMTIHLVQRNEAKLEIEKEEERSLQQMTYQEKISHHQMNRLLRCAQQCHLRTRIIHVSLTQQPLIMYVEEGIYSHLFIKLMRKH